jgi:hypothetical protein
MPDHVLCLGAAGLPCVTSLLIGPSALPPSSDKPRHKSRRSATRRCCLLRGTLWSREQTPFGAFPIAGDRRFRPAM